MMHNCCGCLTKAQVLHGVLFMILAGIVLKSFVSWRLALHKKIKLVEQHKVSKRQIDNIQVQIDHDKFEVVPIDVKNRPRYVEVCPNGDFTAAAMYRYCYQFHTKKKNRKDAKAVCSLTGATLATIRSFNEQSFIYIHGQYHTDAKWWIGLKQVQINSLGIQEWEWDDKFNSSYSFWDRASYGISNHDEPADDVRSEKCAYMTSKERSGFWASAKCDEQFFFVCKIPYATSGATIAEPGVTTSPENTGDTFTHSFYKEKCTWSAKQKDVHLQGFDISLKNKKTKKKCLQLCQKIPACMSVDFWPSGRTKCYRNSQNRYTKTLYYNSLNKMEYYDYTCEVVGRIFTLPNSAATCTWRIERKKKLKGHAISKTSGISLVNCRKSCESNQACKSFDYKKSQSKCILHSKTRYTASDKFIDNKAFVYYDYHCPETMGILDEVVNTTFTHADNGRKCTWNALRKKKYLKGYDLNIGFKKGRTLKQCQTACQNKKGCKSFEYNIVNTKCLANSEDRHTKKKDYIDHEKCNYYDYTCSASG